MNLFSVTTSVAVAALSVAALTACVPPGDVAESSVPAAGVDDVVIATSMSRNRGVETHYAECAADPNARIGDYEVVIPRELDYGGLPEGSPCPVGPREPMPQDEYPELYAAFSEAISEPMPYGGGDIDSPCGTWGTVDPARARQLAVECGPLTRGDLTETGEVTG